MISAPLRSLVLFLAFIAFSVKVQAVGICDWDVRTYTQQQGSVNFKTLRSGRYTKGYIGEVPFVSKWFSSDTCYVGDEAFKCVYVDDGGILGTNITVPNITNADVIYIDSTYPVTIHRIEDHVQNKSLMDRFIVDEDMQLTKCPKYKQTTLVWKFPGSVQNRTAFECFREGTRLCKGVTTGNETNKCVVTVDGGNLVHTRVVNSTKDGVEIFYCRLDPATPHRALTYNIDWRNATEVPPGGIPRETLVLVEKPKNGSQNTTSAAKRLTALSLGSLMALFATLADNY
ncbi:hypothetical protein SprV_0602246200 [Sparganum proliferum]